MTKIIVYRPEACSPPRGKSAVLALDSYPWKLKLTPGNNTVSDTDANKAESHPSWERYAKHGALSVKDAPEEQVTSDSTAAPENLTRLNVDEAEKLIDETTNVELLQKWLQAEPRKTTQGDLSRRIAALTEA